MSRRTDAPSGVSTAQFAQRTTTNRSAPGPKPLPANPLAHLRASTADCHQTLEEHSILTTLTDGTLTRLQYMEILQRFHIFHAALEPALGRWLRPILGDAEWRSRCRLSLLEADLGTAAVAVPPASIRTVNACLPTSPAHAIGVFYVVEGSTLGGQVICRNVHKTLGEAVPVTYFSSYGRDVGMKWRETCRIIETNLPDSRSLADASTAAVNTFEVLTKLFAM